MRTRKRRARYQPALAYVMAHQARSSGVDLDAVPGPWRASQRWHDRDMTPIVTNGRTEFMVDSASHAVDVAGLLNLCGIDDFAPDPDLVPTET